MITQPLRQRYETSNSKRPEKWLVRLGVLLALFMLFWINRGFVKPIAMAGLFAATLYPLHLRFERRVKSQTARAALLTALFAIMFIVPIGVVAFLAADAGLKRFQSLPEDWSQAFQLDPWIDRAAQYLPFAREDILHVLQKGGTAVGQAILNLLQGLVSDLPKLTLDNAVIVFGLFVFLSESQRILKWLSRVSPLSERKTQKLFSCVGGLAGSVVLATIASGLVQSLIIGIACVALSIPGTFLIIMTAFVFSFIPVAGTLPVTLYLIGSAALAGNWTHAIVFAVAAAIAGVSDNFVRPYVLSGTASLHPLVGFIAAFGALETMGFYGLFLGPVLAGAVFMLVDLVLE